HRRRLPGQEEHLPVAREGEPAPLLRRAAEAGPGRGAGGTVQPRARHGADLSEAHTDLPGEPADRDSAERRGRGGPGTGRGERRGRLPEGDEDEGPADVRHRQRAAGHRHRVEGEHREQLDGQPP
ncbi:hypothetical protein THAOC_11315, partial [Thalassiosira oceanica]